jgi:Ca2+-binding EF-hand superfamily protein
VLTKKTFLLPAVLAALLCAFGALALAQKAEPKPTDKAALAENEVKQLLLLMDTDKNGKISRQEFMNFMQTEFDRLDKDKSGELDPKELAQSQLRVSRPAVGK